MLVTLSVIVLLISSMLALYMNGYINNREYGWGIPVLARDNLREKFIEHTQKLGKDYYRAMANGKWVLLRNIQNLTSAENIIVDMLDLYSGSAPLIRSSIVINKSPAVVAAYFNVERTAKAQNSKIQAWSKFSSAWNLGFPPPHTHTLFLHSSSACIHCNLLLSVSLELSTSEN